MLLWKKFEDVMKDGCSKCITLGGMSSELNSSFNRMRKKRNVAGGRKIGSSFRDIKD